MSSWIKLHRVLLDNDLWKSEPFTRGQAWVDLLMLANHKESFFYKRGVKIDVKPGQLARSEVELSDRWKWSRSKIRRFLNDLEKEQQIKITKSNVTQVVTIVNWSTYQQEKTASDTPKRQQKNTYKNVNNNTIDKSIDIDYDKLKDTYNSICTNLPKCQIVSDKRRALIRAVVKQMGKEGLLEVMKKANKSNFLIGKNDRGWKANFDFVLHPEQSIRILEGFYDDNSSNKTNWNLYTQ